MGSKRANREKGDDPALRDWWAQYCHGAAPARPWRHEENDEETCATYCTVRVPRSAAPRGDVARLRRPYGSLLQGAKYVELPEDHCRSRRSGRDLDEIEEF